MAKKRTKRAKRSSVNQRAAGRDGRSTARRATREDWLRAAVKLLARGGGKALTIERLCAAMGKTKGGFYHHFGDAAGLREAVLDWWEARQTTAFIEAAEREGDLEQRGQVLDRLVGAADWGEERAIRAWAWQERAVQARVDAVDQRRVEYVMGFYPELPRAQARRLALIEYAALIGAHHLFLSRAERSGGAAMSRLLRDALQRVAARTAT